MIKKICTLSVVIVAVSLTAVSVTKASGCLLVATSCSGEEEGRPLPPGALVPTSEPGVRALTQVCDRDVPQRCIDSAIASVGQITTGAQYGTAFERAQVCLGRAEGSLCPQFYSVHATEYGVPSPMDIIGRKITVALLPDKDAARALAYTCSVPYELGCLRQTVFAGEAQGAVTSFSLNPDYPAGSLLTALTETWINHTSLPPVADYDPTADPANYAPYRKTYESLLTAELALRNMKP